MCITEAKKTAEREWLSEVFCIPLQQSIQDLGTAYSNFFKSCRGERKGPKIKPPRFKKKANQQSARYRRGGFSIKAAKVSLAKIGYIKTKWSRPLPSEPSSVTVIKDTAGRYFVSFVIEIEPEINPAQNESIGIDLGLKTFAVLSTGTKVNLACLLARESSPLRAVEDVKQSSDNPSETRQQPETMKQDRPPPDSPSDH
ncbi:RNA-guided endonuclease InsQ/TnpB family protein [Leptolyngbya sp. 7M]|uniref:RNA-guided endonuclease InsQ/TnpB family protein n=1 Tax=Leptolyngbya sp. 7M TaxID=2812896 RepID=UPI001B8C7251|nr:transposase [Leptolyngbya sp. 7M]QYO68315.1 hypothetical protein JVX88_17030 [Leptolyngbya sp. 7M]